MDRQFGRLFTYIKQDPALLENTLIIFTSDNGPDAEVNTAGHLRGVKASLYEGGFREPSIAWWPSVIPQAKNGSVNERSVVAAVSTCR
jgi:arylsulfatase A-like enzyme